MNNKSKTSALEKYVKAAQPEQVTPTTPPVRRRGRGESVALTVRLSRSQWERVHQLAIAEGVSIQHLAVVGLAKIFKEKGLPDLTK